MIEIELFFSRPTVYNRDFISTPYIKNFNVALKSKKASREEVCYSFGHPQSPHWTSRQLTAITKNYPPSRNYILSLAYLV